MNGTSQTRRIRRRGFTVMEITIAIAILCVLGAILFSVFQRSRSSARRAQCDVRMKSIVLALDAFRQERGYFPPDLDTLVTEKYLPDTSVLSCPADPRPNPTYADFYVIRNPRANNELPILVCPFHEDTNQAVQASTGRYTSQFRTSPAKLAAGSGVTVEHPNETPVAAPIGLELHGADRLRTASGGFATIEFADGSKADLGANADVTLLQSYTEGQTQGLLYSLVHQNLGTVRYEVNHGSKFDVVTPTATAGALGTRFEIRVLETKATWLLVTEGKVRFNTLAGEVTTELDNWYSAPPPPPPFAGPQRGPGPKPERPSGGPPG